LRAISTVLKMVSRGSSCPSRHLRYCFHLCSQLLQFCSFQTLCEYTGQDQDTESSSGVYTWIPAFQMQHCFLWGFIPNHIIKIQRGSRTRTWQYFFPVKFKLNLVNNLSQKALFWYLLSKVFWLC